VAIDPLDEARALIRAGKVADAQEILHPFIRANPHAVDAWLLETETWNTAGKIRVLEICLEHNPGNLRALQAMKDLLTSHRDRMLELAYQVRPQDNIPDTEPGPPEDLLTRLDRLRFELEQSRRLMEQVTHQFGRLQTQVDSLRQEIARQAIDPKPPQ
jgi:hypothetical protein